MVTTTFDTGVHYLFLAKPYIKLHYTELRLHFAQISVKGSGGKNIVKLTL